MLIGEAFSHLETHGQVLVLVKLVRHLDLGREAVQRFSCHHLQSTVDGQVRDIIEQTTCTIWLLNLPHRPMQKLQTKPGKKLPAYTQCLRKKPTFMYSAA